MKKKALAILSLTAAMSLSLPLVSHAYQWEKLADGSYKGWQEDKNLNEDSGYYNVHNYKWVQQEDGTWKAYHTHDYWRTLCRCSLGHLSDPKYTCPGRLDHDEEWMIGPCSINDNYYLFDENGILQTNRWVSVPEKNSIKKSIYTQYNIYDYAIYEFYDENGTKIVNGTRDGRTIINGLWFDPSVIPFKEDGRIDIAKLDWKETIPYTITEKIREEYTPEEILDGFRNLPEYVGESTNEYGVLTLQFSDYRISGQCSAIYSIALHWDELMRF